MKSYILGKVAKIAVQLTSSTAVSATAGVEPGGLTFYLTEPDGTTYSYVRGTNAQLVSGAASGYFYVAWPTAKEGVHYGGWAGTGSNAGADEFAFHVRARAWD